MIEVLVELDFACCACSATLNVKLKCAGKGLANGGNPIAQVNVPCPICCKINQVCFEPSGTVHAIQPCKPGRGIPEPCWN
jgi:hypothetical protein